MLNLVQGVNFKFRLYCDLGVILRLLNRTLFLEVPSIIRFPILSEAPFGVLPIIIAGSLVILDWLILGKLKEVVLLPV